MSTPKPTEAFDVVNRYLGWGDPNGGLWFIGLEESAAYGVRNGVYSSEDLGKELKTIKERGEYEILTNPPEPGGRDAANVRAYICKIACCVSERAQHDMSSWETYRDKYLYVIGNKVFQANLYPLGKKDASTSSWPTHYKECFGFGSDDYREYIDLVKQTRFGYLRQFKQCHHPKAIVCFGKTDGWPDIRELYSLGSGTEPVPGKLVVYENERIILTPFFGRGMSDMLALEVGKTLSRWGVSIP